MLKIKRLINEAAIKQGILDYVVVTHNYNNGTGLPLILDPTLFTHNFRFMQTPVACLIASHIHMYGKPMWVTCLLPTTHSTPLVTHLAWFSHGVCCVTFRYILEETILLGTVLHMTIERQSFLNNTMVDQESESFTGQKPSLTL